MRFLSFFAGIGGIELGLERAGHVCVGQIEIDEFCQQVLTKHWEDVPKWRDIKELDGSELPEADLWTAGFPCQDISIAGKKRGIQGEKSGLFFELTRLIRVGRPRYILLENVANLLSRSEWMGAVLGELASIGYDAEWETISAKSVGAPHLRKRVFIFADYGSKRSQGFWSGQIPRFNEFSWIKDVRRVEDLRGRPNIPEPLIWGNCNGIPNGVDRTRALGNAVVPQVAEFIGRQLRELER